jgi:hypothetical protein
MRGLRSTSPSTRARLLGSAFRIHGQAGGRRAACRRLPEPRRLCGCGPAPSKPPNCRTRHVDPGPQHHGHIQRRPPARDIGPCCLCGRARPVLKSEHVTPAQTRQDTARPTTMSRSGGGPPYTCLGSLGTLRRAVSSRERRPPSGLPTAALAPPPATTDRSRPLTWHASGRPAACRRRILNGLSAGRAR